MSKQTDLALQSEIDVGLTDVIRSAPIASSTKKHARRQNASSETSHTTTDKVFSMAHRHGLARVHTAYAAGTSGAPRNIEEEKRHQMEALQHGAESVAFRGTWAYLNSSTHTSHESAPATLPGPATPQRPPHTSWHHGAWSCRR